MALPQVGLEAVIEGMSAFKRNSNTVTKSFGDIDKSINKVDKTSGGVGKTLTTLGSTIGKVGIVAAGVAVGGIATLAAALTTFAAGGVVAAADLEQQIANIGAVMGKTKDEVQPLKDLIQDLALNPNLKVNTTEAAAAIELLARNGLEMTDIMEGAALQTVALANATGADFGQAADITTDVLTVFGIAVEDMGVAVDGVAGVMTNSKFTADDYALALSNAGAIANSSGVSLQDFNTVIASSASFFSSGSDAGTSFKTALQRLSNPTDEAAALMEELGIDVFDASGEMRSMGEIAGQLNNALGSMSDEQRSATAAQLGGADASRTLLALSKLTEEQFNSLSSEVNRSGAAMDAAATRMDTLKGSMEILSGIFEAVKIQVGDKFLPIVTDLIKELSVLADQAAPQVIAVFDNIAMGLDTIIAAFQSGGFQAGVAELGSIIESTYTNVIAPALTTWANQFWDWLNNDVIPNASAQIGTFANTVSQFVTDNWPTVQASLVQWGNQAMDWVQTTAIPNATTAITNFASQISQFISDNWPTVQMSLLTWGNQFMDWIDTTAIPNATTAIANFASQISQFVSDNWPTVQTALLTWGNQFMNWVQTTAIPSASTAITNFANTASQFISDNWPTVQASLVQWGNQFWDFITNTVIPMAGQKLAVFGNAIVQWANSSEAQTQMQNFGNTIGTAIGKFIETYFQARENVDPIMMQLGTALLGAVAVISTTLATVAVNVVKGIIDGIVSELAGPDWQNQLGDGLTQLILPAVQGWVKASENYQTILNMGVEIIKGVIAGIASQADALWQSIRDTFDTAINNVKSFLGISSPSTVFKGFGEDMMQGLIDGILSLKDSVLGTLSGIGSSLVDTGSSVIGSIFGGGEEAAANVQAPTISFDASGLLELQQVQPLVNSINTGLLEIANITFALLTEIVNTFVENFIAQFTLVQTWLSTVDLALFNMYTITFPQLLIQAQITTNGIVIGFQAVLLAVNQVTAAVVQLMARIVELGNVAASSAKKIAEAMKEVAETFEEAGEAAKDLEKEVYNLVEAYDKLKEAAEAASKAAKDASTAAEEDTGVSASEGVGASRGLGLMAGIGFQSGTLGLGLGFKVPPGYPNDSFPMRVESGEEVMVTPRGQTIEGVIAQRLGKLISGPGLVQAPAAAIYTTINHTYNYYFNQTVNTGASAQAVIGQYEVMKAIVG